MLGPCCMYIYKHILPRCWLLMNNFDVRRISRSRVISVCIYTYIYYIIHLTLVVWEKKQVVTDEKPIFRPLQLGKRSICRWLIVCWFFIIFPGAKLVCTSKHSLGIQPRTRFFRTGVTACHHAKASWNSDNEPTLATKELERERERGRDTYYIMWLKQCHKLPMTGNGNHTTYKKWWWLGDGLWHCFNHIIYI